MRVCVLALCAAAVPAAFGGLTLDEDFGGRPQAIGIGAASWDAKPLVGENRGSVFFDVAFDEALPPKMGERSVLMLRTHSRYRLGCVTYGNKALHFMATDTKKSYFFKIVDGIEPGRTYRIGFTWDGEAIRLYRDGICVHSGVQPLPVRTKSLSKLYAGPFKDGWINPPPWADDVRLFRVRTWDAPRTPAEVAAESGVRITPVIESHPAVLTVPALPDGVAAPTVDGKLDERAWTFAGSMPQLVRGNFTGKSGTLPPHGFQLFTSGEGLYLAVSTLFPGRVPYQEGQTRTSDYEPEPWGSESWEFHLRLGGHRYRFAANAAGGTTEWRDGDAKWNGEWKHAFAKAMKIDDSVLWTCEAFIPWKTLGTDTAPAAGTEARLNVCRTWTLACLGGFSSLDFTGRSYGFNETWPTVRLGGGAAGYRLESRTDPAAGFYEERYALAADRASTVIYDLSLARKDGSFAPMSVYRHAYKMAKGETLSDSARIDTSVPGYDAIVHTVEQDGTVVMRETVPYDLEEEVFTATPFHFHEEVRVAFKKPFSGKLTLTGPDGRTVLEKPVEGGTLALPFPRTNAAGTYELTVTDGAGKKAGSKSFSYPGVGAWERQDFHEDWILPGFDPLETKVVPGGFGSRLYGRVYAWERSLLPSRLTSRKERLLVRPMELLVDGVAAACTDFSVVSNAPHHVGFAAKGAAGGATLEETGWLEYDGVQFNRVTVTPAGKGGIRIRYVLPAAVSKFVHAAHGGSWGAKRTEFVKEGSSAYGGFTTFWIGDEEKGLCFFVETRDGWTADVRRSYELEKTGETLTVTVNVTEKLPAGKPFAFEFGFVASPVKRLAANYPLDTFGDTYIAYFNRPGRRPLCDVSYMQADEVKGGDLGSFFGDLDTPDGKKRDAKLKFILEKKEKDRGTRPVPYTCARDLSIKYPETAAFLPEWTFEPVNAMDYSHTGHFVYDCCPTTTASDFFVWKFKGMLERYPGMHGIYFDFGVVNACANANHGCRGRIPLLGQREFYRRHIVAQVERGIRDPVVVLHNTDCVQLPAMTFATHLLNGEYIRQSSSTILHDKKDILDTFGREMFASELSSLPWGIANAVYMPFDSLLAKNGGDEKFEPYKFRMGKASLGACLLHNTMQCPWRNHLGLFDKIVRFYDAFGVDKARFVGYWRKPAAVKGADDIYVSCYTDGTKVLAVVAQLGKEHHDQDVEIAFDWTALGLKSAPKQATDLMTAPDPDYEWLFKRFASSGIYKVHAPLALGEFGTKVNGFDGTALKYHLPYHTFGLVELK